MYVGLYVCIIHDQDTKIIYIKSAVEMHGPYLDGAVPVKRLTMTPSPERNNGQMVI